MKSYTRKNTYNRLIAGVLHRGTKPKGKGWVEVIPKSDCNSSTPGTINSEPVIVDREYPETFGTGYLKIKMEKGFELVNFVIIDITELGGVPNQLEWCKENLATYGTWSLNSDGEIILNPFEELNVRYVKFTSFSYPEED
jgi:hypothetical protein